MIGHIAGGMSPTHSWARITTLVVDAGLVARTLRVDSTLWLAFHIGIANIVPDAGTGGSIASVCALSIDAAWAGVARLYLLNGQWSGWKMENKVQASYQTFSS
jgi:hypothetical protein